MAKVHPDFGRILEGAADMASGHSDLQNKISFKNKNDGFTCSIYSLLQEIQGKAIKINDFRREMLRIISISKSVADET